MSRRTVSSVKKSADRLWSQLVKARAGHRCERCGTIPESALAFHAHHVYGRSNHRLRFEPRNGTALCWTDHRWAEEMPLEFADWFREHRSEDARWLASENRRGLLKRSLADYLELEEFLTERLEAAQNGSHSVVGGV